MHHLQTNRWTLERGNGSERGGGGRGDFEKYPASIIVPEKFLAHKTRLVSELKTKHVKQDQKISSIQMSGFMKTVLKKLTGIAS